MGQLARFARSMPAVGIAAALLGHPLYTFTGDRSAGETNGEGQDAFGARWYVVGTDGNQIVKSSGY